jgi:hypothetical protein
MSTTPVNRDSFYDDEFDDDGADYEVLPPDEEVIAGEQARAAESVRQARDASRVAELYKGPEQMSAKELLGDIPEFQFRFTTKHILITMTLLAVILTIGMLVNLFVVILVGTFLMLAGAYGYINWKEHQHREQWYRERMGPADNEREENS